LKSRLRAMFGSLDAFDIADKGQLLALAEVWRDSG
jgi:hypothetical protein